MKIFLLLIGIYSIAFSQQNKKDIIGFWKPENLDGIIEIYQEGDTFLGKVALILVEGDSIVPKNLLRTLSDFKFDGKDTWEDGAIYIRKRQKEIDGKISFDDEENLKVTGYVSFLFSKSFTWFKLDSSKIKKTILSKQ